MSNYATLSQVKSALRITDQIDDSLLNTSISSASRWVDGYCDRGFSVAAAATAIYVPTGRMDDLAVDDWNTVTSIAIDEDLDDTFSLTLRPIDYLLLPLNRRSGNITFPYNRVRPQEDGYWPVSYGRATVRIVGTRGWPAIPDAVREATILQAARLYTRLSSPLGVVSFGDMGAVRVSRFADPDVEMLLAPYKLTRF
jgi:hypothetical protein